MVIHRIFPNYGHYIIFNYSTTGRLMKVAKKTTATIYLNNTTSNDPIFPTTSTTTTIKIWRKQCILLSCWHQASAISTTLMDWSISNISLINYCANSIRNEVKSIKMADFFQFDFSCRICCVRCCFHCCRFVSCTRARHRAYIYNFVVAHCTRSICLYSQWIIICCLWSFGYAAILWHEMNGTVLRLITFMFFVVPFLVVLGVSLSPSKVHLWFSSLLSAGKSPERA